jgi:hypothetical protein
VPLIFHIERREEKKTKDKFLQVSRRCIRGVTTVGHQYSQMIMVKPHKNLDYYSLLQAMSVY